MARPSNAQKLASIHQEALREFDQIQTAIREERLQCIQDRRFYSIAGAQWEGPLGEQFENRPKIEVNKIALAVQRIFSEYRANRITVNYVSKEGDEYDELADTCDKLYRADEQDSSAEEAYDNAFEEAVGGGIGAWRLRAVYEDEYDEDNDKQRIRIEPIFDADSSVYFDLTAKRQDKADAKRCFVLTAMTPEAYTETWGDDPATWPKDVGQSEFDWYAPDVVYVAEYYRVEDTSETVHFFRGLDGEEEKYTEEELTDETRAELEAIGSVEVRSKKVKRRRVRKYIMSGGGVLEDCGYIAGRHIPVVVAYGKRWFVDNVERCCGHVRLAKDAQRLANMQRSKLAEIAALSSVEKPILLPEQVAGHQMMWQEDNLKNYPYLLLNPITGPDGSVQPAGPVGYTKPPAVPPALAALLQISETDIKDVLGNQEQGDKMVANVSGKAVEMIQQRLDMQTFLYMSNFAKAIRRSGEIWLSMAREVYVEPGRKMKGIGDQGQIEGVELMRPMVDDDGELEYENDLSEAEFDVAVEVGPSSSSKRSATVRALTQMMGLTGDPETAKVLQAAALMNMEGEGLSDIRDHFRKQLVGMGVIEPTDKEKEMMAQAQQQPDPNAELVKAATMETLAKAEKAQADARLSDAKAAQTLEDIGQAPEQPAQPMQAQPVQPVMTEQDLLDIEAKQLDNAAKRVKLEAELLKIEQMRAPPAPSAPPEVDNTVNETIQGLQDGIKAMSEAVATLGSVFAKMAEANAQNSEKALEALQRPKRIVREKGRITRIEVE